MLPSREAATSTIRHLKHRLVLVRISAARVRHSLCEGLQSRNEGLMRSRFCCSEPEVERRSVQRHVSKRVVLNLLTHDWIISLYDNSPMKQTLTFYSLSKSRTHNARALYSVASLAVQRRVTRRARRQRWEGNPPGPPPGRCRAPEGGRRLFVCSLTAAPPTLCAFLVSFIHSVRCASPAPQHCLQETCRPLPALHPRLSLPSS